MTRSTVYNHICTKEKTAQINKNNIALLDDFLDYLSSIDRSPATIYQYKSDLMVYFTYILDYMGNKDFNKVTKRELTRFQSFCLNEYGWAPKRMRRVKSVISSLSNYIVNMLADEEEEYEDFKNIVGRVESPSNVAVRDKTVLTTDEVQTLLDTLSYDEEYEQACAVAILVYSGMRKAELLQMKPEFFDDEHIIFDSLYQTDKIRAKGRGKLGKQIHKWVMLKAKPYIDKWMEYRKEHNIECEYLFIAKSKDEYRKRESVESWMSHWSDILQTPIYCHNFRHYVCSYLINDYNLPNEVVKEFFQWSSADMVGLYNDRSAAEDFGKYFTANGVVQQEEKTLTDL